MFKRSLLHYHLFLIKLGCRYFYSWYFNLKYFPWTIAKRLPFVFYKNAYAKICGKGKIVLTDSFIKGNKHVFFGQDIKDFDYQCEKSYLQLEGCLTVDGDVTVRRGAVMHVYGDMFIEDQVVVCSRTRITVHNSVKLGYNTRVAHEVQIFDTNFHPTKDVSNGQCYPISKPIIIGRNCWIGNRTTINKGTILPDNTTVASNSLVSKDYSDLAPYSLIGGIPAKLLKNNYSIVWDAKLENECKTREFEWYRLRQK